MLATPRLLLSWQHLQRKPGGAGNGGLQVSPPLLAAWMYGASSAHNSCTSEFPGRYSRWSPPLSPHCLLSWEMLGRIKTVHFSLLWCPGSLCLCLGIVWVLLSHNSEGKHFPWFINSVFWRSFSDFFWKDKKELQNKYQHFVKWDTWLGQVTLNWSFLAPSARLQTSLGLRFWFYVWQ